MKENSNKVFLFFYFYFYLMRDLISKDLELLCFFKALRIFIIISLLTVILNVVKTIIILT